MKETWKELFDDRFVTSNDDDKAILNIFYDPIKDDDIVDELKDFISKEIIEKIIDDIPDAEIDEYLGDSVSLLELKDQLKEKWLN